MQTNIYNKLKHFKKITKMNERVQKKAKKNNNKIRKAKKKAKVRKVIVPANT